MATRTRPRTGMQSSYEHIARDERDDMRNGGSRGGSHGLSKGIHVSAEMPDPRTARITIDIDWQNLVSRVAHKVRRKIKERRSSTGSSRRAPSRSRRSSA